jgi:2-oxoglutarate dehydrogenase E1 component
MMENGPAFHGPNEGYVLELYDQYLADPASVDSETRRFFEAWAPPTPHGRAPSGSPTPGIDTDKLLAAVEYVGYLRRYGHLAAQLSPLADFNGNPQRLSPAEYGLTEADLAALPPSVVNSPAGRGARDALEAINRLQAIYGGAIAYEFNHVQDKRQRDWLRDAIESQTYLVPRSDEARRDLLQQLTRVEAFERFLHQTYLGQKRFSVEGTDAVVPMLLEIISDANMAGVREVIIGMAHRGRLNVLTHVLGKPYHVILAEFEHLPEPGFGQPDMSSQGYLGDVKYHKGWRRRVEEREIPVTLAPNPSHLEYVDPVVVGMTRARQDRRDQPGEPLQDTNAAMAILLHGDAAFPGQGIVAETLNLAGLHGYSTGGTIHIITNNQVGFTTNPSDARSTLYASDLAKGFEIPVVHVNADDAEACIAVARFAIDYREEFQRDFLIDLVGYRRWGHNEGDEPTFTQPKMYATINSHPTARSLYAQRLEAEGLIPAGEGDRMLNTQLDQLAAIRDEVRKNAEAPPKEEPPLLERVVSLDTEVDAGLLRSFNERIHAFEDGFSLNSKLSRQVERRKGAIERDGAIDWAHAEALAFATILAEGTPIRLTGQDVERGTFSQRHLVLHDPETGETLTMLERLPEAKASFAVYNSPLSEAGVLGFEYGYSVAAPDALVLWEAQFGDFANSGQVIIDQFLAAGQAKWMQTAGLVLLLPHGYEGQGPEHSSARLERFLQLAANQNIRVANCTTAGQYFHLLRRQAKLLQSAPRPLIVMTPKSLLRHPKAGASLLDLASGAFQPVIDDERAASHRKRVRRIALCTGKVYVDLISSQAIEQADEVALVRVEELYPFPSRELSSVIERYPNLEELAWVQEEPRNMGAWSYVEPRLRAIAGDVLPVGYIGRPEQASPAEGSADNHQDEQARIIQTALAAKARELQMQASDD